MSHVTYGKWQVRPYFGDWLVMNPNGHDCYRFPRFKDAMWLLNFMLCDKGTSQNANQ